MRRALACLLIALWASVAYGAVAYDNRTSSITSGFSHTVGATANLAVGVFCVDSGTITVSSASIGGQALAFQHRELVSSSGACEIWTKVSPPTGAQTVSVTWSGSDNDVLTMWTFTGVDTVDPFDAPVGDGNSTDASSLNVSSRVGDMVVDGVYMQSLVTETAGPDQVQVFSLADGTATEALGSIEPGAPTVTMSWALQSGVFHAHVAMNIRASAAARKALPLVVE